MSVGVYIRLFNGLEWGCGRRGSLRESKEQELSVRGGESKKNSLKFTDSGIARPYRLVVTFCFIVLVNLFLLKIFSLKALHSFKTK